MRKGFFGRDAFLIIVDKDLLKEVEEIDVECVYGLDNFLYTN